MRGRLPGRRQRGLRGHHREKDLRFPGHLSDGLQENGACFPGAISQPEGSGGVEGCLVASVQAGRAAGMKPPGQFKTRLAESDKPQGKFFGHIFAPAYFTSTKSFPTGGQVKNSRYRNSWLDRFTVVCFSPGGMKITSPAWMGISWPSRISTASPLMAMMMD